MKYGKKISSWELNYNTLATKSSPQEFFYFYGGAHM